MNQTPPQSCQYFSEQKCTSCTLLKLPRHSRHSSKESKFRNAARAAFGDAISIENMVNVPEAFGSRGKAKLTVSGSQQAPIMGLADGTNATELLDCPLHHPSLNALLPTIKKLITDHKLAPYHITRQQGELKGIILKCNFDGSQISVRFVLRSDESLGKIKRLARDLQKAHASVTVVSANIQPIAAAILEGEREVLFTNETCVWDKFNSNIELAFHPQTFCQVTHSVAEKLYARVAQHLKSVAAKSMLDLFCGVGGFSIHAAKTAKLDWVIGVELSAHSIDCAKLNAEKNNIQNSSFQVGDVEAFLKSYSLQKPETILFNPPRRGLTENIIVETTRLGPEHVLYSSCNPETLFRDLVQFTQKYEVTALAPFDMFPLTEHLEVLAILKKRAI